MTIRDAVLAAYCSGAVTRRDIAAATGLASELVDLTVDLLLRTGEMATTNLRSGCASGGCGQCSEDTRCAPGPVTLRLRPIVWHEAREADGECLQ